MNAFEVASNIANKLLRGNDDIGVKTTDDFGRKFEFMVKGNEQLFSQLIRGANKIDYQKAEGFFEDDDEAKKISQVSLAAGMDLLMTALKLACADSSASSNTLQRVKQKLLTMQLLVTKGWIEDVDDEISKPIVRKRFEDGKVANIALETINGLFNAYKGNKMQLSENGSEPTTIQILKSDMDLIWKELGITGRNP